MLSSIENNSHALNNNNNNNSNNGGNNKIGNNGGNSGQDHTLLHYTNGKLPRAVFICHPNSHTFLDRTLVLDKPVKIGRSVGHARATVNNGIFDCKVLSRNHALIWYAEGKFYLKDTKSSNGTFVNRERLSRSVEESSPQEIFSGDTVQFGVDVVESSQNVTHGCIIATLKLFHPDGQEAKPKPASTFSVGENNKISLEDLYCLNEYLQEALQREQLLESKLSSLRQVMQLLKEGTEASWNALISNNNLLSRVEFLELQLQCYSKKFAEDKLREELRLLQEDKNNYQVAVKEYFQKLTEEKLDAVQKYQDLARALVNSKTECGNTKQLLVGCQNELRELAHKHTAQEKLVESLEEKLYEAELKYKELHQQLLDSTHNLEGEIKNHIKNEESLRQTIKELECNGEFARRQITSLQQQIEEMQRYNEKVLNELIDPDIIMSKVNSVESIKSWIVVYVDMQKKMEETVVRIRNKVNDLRNEKLSTSKQIGALECELDKYSVELQDYREEETDLTAKIRHVEKDLESFKPVPDILGGSMDDKNRNRSEDLPLLQIELQDKKKLMAVIQKNIKMLEEKCQDVEEKLRATKENVMQLTVSYVIEEDRLVLLEKQNLNLEVALRSLKEHAESAAMSQLELAAKDDGCSLKSQLLEAHEITLNKKWLIAGLTKYFAEFTDLISDNLGTLDVSMKEFMEYNREVYAFDDTLRSLKSDTSSLINAISDLQMALCESFLMSKLNVTGDSRDSKSNLLIIESCNEMIINDSNEEKSNEDIKNDREKESNEKCDEVKRKTSSTLPVEEPVVTSAGFPVEKEQASDENDGYSAQMIIRKTEPQEDFSSSSEDNTSTPESEISQFTSASLQQSANADELIGASMVAYPIRLPATVADADAAAPASDRELALQSDLLILKEKYRMVLSEKLYFEEKLGKLQQEYGEVIRYPYFNLYFTLPVILLICVYFSCHSDVLSILFGTKDSIL